MNSLFIYLSIYQSIYQLKGAELKLVIRKGFAADWVHAAKKQVQGQGRPAVPYVNVVLAGGVTAGHGSSGDRGAVLLANPIGAPPLNTCDALLENVSAVFGLQGRSYRLLDGSGAELQAGADVSRLNRATLTVGPKTADVTHHASADVDGCVCKFVNVDVGAGVLGTLLLENPVGRLLCRDGAQLDRLASQLFQSSAAADEVNKKRRLVCGKVKVAADGGNNVPIESLHGQTLSFSFE